VVTNLTRPPNFVQDALCIIHLISVVSCTSEECDLGACIELSVELLQDKQETIMEWKWRSLGVDEIKFCSLRMSDFLTSAISKRKATLICRQPHYLDQYQ